MTPLIVDNTPVETHFIGDISVLVKREDLCSPLPGPSFSKIRGVLPHMQARIEEGVKVFGVLDTFHSKAGWAVSYVGHHLAVRVYNFYPHYKTDKANVYREQQQAAYNLCAEMRPIPAGRSSILYHQAKKDLQIFADGSNAYMMPNALKLPESVTENAAEAIRTAPIIPPTATIVISVSSGTVAAGVIKGLMNTRGDYHFILHMGYHRDVATVRKYMQTASGVEMSPNLVEFIDEGYEYADAAKGGPAPFPSNPYYDLKAWRWLKSNGIYSINRPIVFWNIGA